MFVDRHAVKHLIGLSSQASFDEPAVRQWLQTIVDAATQPAREEFAKALSTGEYPENAITAKGAPQNPGSVSLSIDRAPRAMILLLNHASDFDVQDPGNEVTGQRRENLLRVIAEWDVAKLQTMVKNDGWAIPLVMDEVDETPTEDQPDDQDWSHFPDVPLPDDQAQEGEPISLPPPSDTPTDIPPDEASEGESAPRPWKKYALWGGGLVSLVLIGAAVVRMRRAQR